MPEDFLAKSGAKGMLATAVAEVLTLRPRVPVAFLASHFQGLVTNKSAAGISCLRSCHPSSPAFPSAVEKAFHDLAAIEAAPTTALSSSSSTDSLQRSSSPSQQGPNPSRKVKAGGPTTISEASFLQILQQLSTDFPKPLQTRFLETALSVTPSASTKETPSSRGVGLARFQRGVQACLLTEELMDAATLLFQALELNSSVSPGAVTSDTLMNAMRSAATSQFPRELTAVLAPLLARSGAPHGTLASPESAPMESSTPTNRNLLQLNDVYDLLFDLAVVS